MCNVAPTTTICGVPRSAFVHFPTPCELAAAFLELSDDAQAEFFVAVGKLANEWKTGRSHQFWAIGRHLRECPNGADGLELVKLIADG